MTLHIEIARLLISYERRAWREREARMAGEIRAKMAGFRAAMTKLNADVCSEIESATKRARRVHRDAVESVKMVHAEVSAHEQEIREICEEFAPLNNGGPDGPLPGTLPNSPSPSPSSEPPKPNGLGADIGPRTGDPEPHASWRG